MNDITLIKDSEIIPDDTLVQTAVPDGDRGTE
jgi:hypothetical protein